MDIEKNISRGLLFLIYTLSFATLLLIPNYNQGIDNPIGIVFATGVPLIIILLLITFIRPVILKIVVAIAGSALPYFLLPIFSSFALHFSSQGFCNEVGCLFIFPIYTITSLFYILLSYILQRVLLKFSTKINIINTILFLITILITILLLLYVNIASEQAMNWKQNGALYGTIKQQIKNKQVTYEVLADECSKFNTNLTSSYYKGFTQQAINNCKMAVDELQKFGEVRSQNVLRFFNVINN